LITGPLRQTFAQQDPDPATGNRLFTAPGSVNIEPTTHSRRDDDYHGNGGVVESHSDVQRGTAMSGSRDAVVESHSCKKHLINCYILSKIRFLELSRR